MAPLSPGQLPRRLPKQLASRSTPAGRLGGARRLGLRLLLAASVPAVLVCSPGAGETGGAEDRASAERSAEVGSTRLGEGFVVWESNRTGNWRIWTRRLDGSGLRQLSPEEGDRQHCCPHVSPDGRTVVYLSGPAAGRDRFPEAGPVGPLHRIGIDGRGDRVLVPEARTYGDDRAAVWTGERELAFIGPSGHTELLDVETGERRRLTREGLAEYGRLVNATLTHATTALPTFSLLDRRSGAVAERTPYGGCEPYFSHDGRWGFWIAGAGGPIHKIDLASREVSVVLAKEDRRLPRARATSTSRCSPGAGCCWPGPPPATSTTTSAPTTRSTSPRPTRRRWRSSAGRYG